MASLGTLGAVDRLVRTGGASALLWAAVAGCVSPGPNIPTLTQADLLRMSRAGFSDDLLIRTIDASEVDVDVSAWNLRHLFDRGLSAAVLEALVVRTARGGRMPVETARLRRDPALAEWEERRDDAGGRRQDGPGP